QPSRFMRRSRGTDARSARQEVGMDGIAIGCVVAIIGIIAQRLTNNTRLLARIDVLTGEVFKLQDASRACQSREADLKAEVVALTRRLGHIERNTGLDGGEIRAGVIVADFRGTICVVGPPLVSLLKWLPDELIGKSVEMLGPADLGAAPREGFHKFVASGSDPTLLRDKVHLTYIKDRDGNRLPVCITY